MTYFSHSTGMYMVYLIVVCRIMKPLCDKVLKAQIKLKFNLISINQFKCRVKFKTHSISNPPKTE